MRALTQKIELAYMERNNTYPTPEAKNWHIEGQELAKAYLKSKGKK